MVGLLTIAEAAERLAISPKHLRQEFVNKGILAVIRLGSSCKGDRIDPSDVDRLIADRKTSRCCIKKVESITSNSRRAATYINDPLGQPVSGKRRSSSAI